LQQAYLRRFKLLTRPVDVLIPAGKHWPRRHGNAVLAAGIHHDRARPEGWSGSVLTKVGANASCWNWARPAAEDVIARPGHQGDISAQAAAARLVGAPCQPGDMEELPSPGWFRPGKGQFGATDSHIVVGAAITIIFRHSSALVIIVRPLVNIDLISNAS
jgi:hypothetical protein